MSRRGPQSFLKRQKEQKRLQRANEKRAARQARREEQATRRNAGGADEELQPLDGPVPVEGMEDLHEPAAGDESEEGGEKG